jgi:hypothetical protein
MMNPETFAALGGLVNEKICSWTEPCKSRVTVTFTPEVLHSQGKKMFRDDISLQVIDPVQYFPFEDPDLLVPRLAVHEGVSKKMNPPDGILRLMVKSKVQVESSATLPEFRIFALDKVASVNFKVNDE